MYFFSSFSRAWPVQGARLEEMRMHTSLKPECTNVHFNRNMPSMSKLVRDVRTRLTKSHSMHERMEHIKDQITTISEA